VTLLLDDGRPVRAPRGGDRIGAGPWARWVASAVVPDEGSARAERGRDLARSGAVHSVRVAPGSVAARVVGSKGAEYDVALETTTVPATTWADVARASRSRAPLVSGVEGTSQSIHLAHLMETEHHEPLVPPSRRIRASCTCPDREHGIVCKHVAAVDFVIAHAIDGDPTVLLRWRGCEPANAPASRSADPWQAGPLPTSRPPRSLPPGAVVKRLGRSGIRVGSDDLADALEPAYRAFASLSTTADDGTVAV
jgi:hypothetical protein